MHNMIEITRPGLTTVTRIAQEISVVIWFVGMNDLMLMLCASGRYKNWIEGGGPKWGWLLYGTDLQIVLLTGGQICFGAELDPFYREGGK